MGLTECVKHTVMKIDSIREFYYCKMSQNMTCMLKGTFVNVMLLKNIFCQVLDPHPCPVKYVEIKYD
jgi:hypothetical protein